MGNYKKVFSAFFVLFALCAVKIFAQVQNVSEDSVISVPTDS